MKKFLSILLVIVMFTTTYMPALADTLCLPGSLNVIEDSSFYGNAAINVVEIPDGTKRIENLAFAHSGVTLAVIPDTVTYIADNAFEGTNAAFRCNEGSYAQSWAESHGFVWTDSNSPDDVKDDLQELKNSEMTREGMYSAEMDAYSADDITDEELLAGIAELNALIEEVNQLAQENNRLADAMVESAAGLLNSLQGFAITETAEYNEIAFEGVRMRMDKHISNAAEQGVTFGEMTASEDGSYYLIAASNGETWYMYEVNNSSYFTVQKPSITARAQSRGLWDDFINAINDGMTRIQLGLNGLSATVSAYKVSANDTLNRQIAERTKWRSLSTRFKYISDEYFRLGDENPYLSQEYYAKGQRWATESLLCEEQAEKLTVDIGKTNTRLTWLGRFSECLAGISALLLGWDIGTLINELMELRSITNHHHPNENDSAPGARDIANKMNRKVGEVKLFLTGKVLVIIAQACTMIISLVAAIPSSGTSVVVMVLVEGIIALLGGMNQSNLNAAMAEVRAYHSRLHTAVFGWVKDFDTEEALENVMVSDGTSQVFTDNIGYYKLYPSPGAVILSFELEGYEKKQDGVVVPDNQTVQRDMTLKREINVIGIVYDERDRAPIEGAMVVCEGQTVSTDAEGRFSLALKPGDHFLSVNKRGYKPEDGVFVRAGSDVKTVEIPMVKQNIILTREDLEAVADYPNDDYVLGRNIDLSDAPWTPLPWFAGSLDGDGYSIDGMYITDAGSGAVGLFEGLANAEIFNLTMTSVSINIASGAEFIQAGALSATANTGTKFINCAVQGSISVSAYGQDGSVNVGGITGTMGQAQLKGCTVDAAIEINADRNVYAGGLSSFMDQAAGSNCHAKIAMNLRQTGSSYSADFCAYGTGKFEEIADNCDAEGSIRVETTNANAYAFGVYNSKNGENRVSVSVVTENSKAVARGCIGGERTVNQSNISAEATGSGTADAIGALDSVGGQNNGDISAKATQWRDATAMGASCVGHDVFNNGAVRAETESGYANAYGVFDSDVNQYDQGAQPSFNCVNTGDISAVTASGYAFAQGLMGCALSENRGKVSVQAQTGSCAAAGLYNSQYGKNYADISAECTGAAYSSGYTVARGLYECTACTNNGNIKANVSQGACNSVAAGAEGGRYNVNNGSIEGRNQCGSAYAFGVHCDSSQNYGTILAYASGIDSNSDAVAEGVHTDNNNSLNTGNVSAVSQNGDAVAHGCAPAASVSTGLASATCLRPISESNYSNYGTLYAGGSQFTQVTLGSFTVSSSNGVKDGISAIKRQPDCTYHLASGIRLTSFSAVTHWDSCYYGCGAAESASFGEYVMPSVPPAPVR